MDWKAWTDWISGSLSATLIWVEHHPGAASWLQAFGSIAAIAIVFLFSIQQSRRARSHEETDRVRRAQGLALLLIPVLTSFKQNIETAILQETKLAAPDEVMYLLDQLYVLGLAGGYILQMVATLQAHQRFEPAIVSEDHQAQSAYNSLARQRLDNALHYCEDALRAMTKLSHVRTV
jgi:hypothetical protein